MVAIEDVLGSWPNVMQRIGTLEKRTCMKLSQDMSEAQNANREIQRRLGDPHAFSVKANRAYASDEVPVTTISHRGQGSVANVQATMPSSPRASEQL